MTDGNFFEDAESIFINGQEVQSIETEDGVILFDKNGEKPSLILKVSGSSFQNSNSFDYNKPLFIDWGDSSGLEEYTGGGLSHTFSDELNTHTIRFYGHITAFGHNCFYNRSNIISIVLSNSISYIGNYCFYNCGFTSINLPNSITSLGDYCFSQCSNLSLIRLNWTSSNDIITYNSGRTIRTSSDLKFFIPIGTTQLYIEAGYPSNKLIENNSI